MSEIKELDFFAIDGNWDNGVDWYKGNFDPTAKIRGESSTSYTRGQNAQVSPTAPRACSRTSS